jgi:hypothetical protein
MYLNYKMMTSFSQDDLKKVGSAIMFAPDSPDSWDFHGSASPSGIGSTNNKTFGHSGVYPSNGGRIYSSAAIGAGAGPVSLHGNGIGEPIDSLYTTNYTSLANVIPQVGNEGLYARSKWTAYNVSASKYTSLFSQA